MMPIEEGIIFFFWHFGGQQLLTWLNPCLCPIVTNFVFSALWCRVGNVKSNDKAFSLQNAPHC
ncbi:hypothetical protein EXN66_Car018250 [Channa argus]|uniref:Uncharacterized protein n=1 Tax=Channa argus TaxID=215402 RepID=A0A6G1QJ35_CHAAH|nr:hypothetical protein EXN66_Car018250 [Channa argus]